MSRLPHIEIVVFKHIVEGEVRGVYPASSLDEQIDQVIHGVSFSQSLWHILQVELIILLAVNA